MARKIMSTIDVTTLIESKNIGVCGTDGEAFYPGVKTETYYDRDRIRGSEWNQIKISVRLSVTEHEPGFGPSKLLVAVDAYVVNIVDYHPNKFWSYRCEYYAPYEREIRVYTAAYRDTINEVMYQENVRDYPAYRSYKILLQKHQGDHGNVYYEFVDFK